MAPRVAVVIPFYQRDRGILVRAVQSALDQKAAAELDIVVVDDASPVPAADELLGVAERPDRRVRVLRRPNGGPGAARNTGLEALSSDTDYVGFLDSDDAWEPTHVGRALAALEDGRDFYFSDFLQLGQTVSAFRRAGRIDLGRHRPLDAGPELYAYEDDLTAQILTGNVIGTSTVVYRRSVAPALRFEEEYSHAGEDYLFWLALCHRTRRVAFSSRVACTYGKGVNVYSGSGWGTEGSLRRSHCEMKYLAAVRGRYELERSVARHVRGRVRGLRRYFIGDLLHRMATRRRVEARLLVDQLRVDPWTGVLFVPVSAMIACSFARDRLRAVRTAISTRMFSRRGAS